MFTNFQIENPEQEVHHMITSDHECLTVKIPLRAKPIMRDPKEFYYSRLINQPKDFQKLETYLEFIIKLLELVTTK